MLAFQLIVRVIMPLVMATIGSEAWGINGLWLIGGAAFFAGWKWEESIQQWAIKKVKAEQQGKRNELSEALTLLLGSCEELSDEARGLLQVERERLKL